MQVFPLLLQIGLFLFSTALSIYLWTIHISLAITVLSITSFGFISYTALLVSAVAAPDSPFQTPLAPVIAQFVLTTLWMKLKTFSGLPLQFIYRLPAACSPYISASADILPFFQNDKQTEKNISTLDVPPTIFDAHFPDPSPEVSAVSWALEASTDPHVINLAAEMVVHLQ
jgi:hypothetical protein